MNYILAQLILAARRSDDKDTGWMRILVIVILAVFYAVGSIVKAKANKTALKKEEQMPRKPGTKPPESVRAPKAFKKTPYQAAVPRPVGRTPSSQARPQVAKPQVQPPRRKVVRPQPVGRKPPTKAGEAIELPIIFEPLEVSKVAAPPKLEPELGELPEFIGEPKAKRVAMPAEIQPAKYLSGILSDYENPERLRSAILHYEILGKPVSLRPPSEHIIGL